MKLIKHHWELDVYKLAMEMAGEVFQLSKSFPKEEAAPFPARRHPL